MCLKFLTYGVKFIFLLFSNLITSWSNNVIFYILIIWNFFEHWIRTLLMQSYNFFLHIFWNYNIFSREMTFYYYAVIFYKLIFQFDVAITASFGIYIFCMCMYIYINLPNPHSSATHTHTHKVRRVNSLEGWGRQDRVDPWKPGNIFQKQEWSVLYSRPRRTLGCLLLPPEMWGNNDWSLVSPTFALTLWMSVKDPGLRSSEFPLTES
jgi:hypothetical protein